METDDCGPALLTQFSEKVQSKIGSDPNRSDQNSEQSKHVCSVKAKKHSDKRKHKPNMFLHYFSQRNPRPLCKSKSLVSPKGLLLIKTKKTNGSRSGFYRRVDMSDLPSQYAEDIETFRQILNLPDLRDTMPRSSIIILGLDDENAQQELRPRGRSAMFPLSPDFQASNLPEGKYIKPPTSTSKCYKVGQPCFEDRLQDLTSDFANICISPKPSWANIWAKFPYRYLKSLSIRQGKISPLLILRQPLLRLLLFVIPPWKSVRTVLCLLSKSQKPNSKGCQS